MHEHYLRIHENDLEILFDTKLQVTIDFHIYISIYHNIYYQHSIYINHSMSYLKLVYIIPNMTKY